VSRQPSVTESSLDTVDTDVCRVNNFGHVFPDD
jgi:hypothetical protein